MLGEDHERTKESSDCLKHLTQQAVVFQKKMNEIVKGKEGVMFPPLQLGEDHERTKESSDCLKHLTQQAVVFQMKMNEIVKGKEGVMFPPLQLLYCSFEEVSLVGLYTISFFTLCQDDIEKFRQEMAKRQQGHSTESKTSPAEIKAEVNEDSTPTTTTLPN